MTPEQRIVTGIAVFLLWALILHLVRRHRLGISQGLLWSGLLLGALLVLAVPGLLGAVTAVTRARFPVSGITLIALLIITLFLFYFSLVTHQLKRRYVELVRSMALLERRLEGRGRPRR